MTSLPEAFIPSGLNKRPAFNHARNTFKGEWNSILCVTERRLVKPLFKKSQEPVSVLEAEIQLEIDWIDGENKILEDIEINLKEYKDKLKKGRNKQWIQIRLWENKTSRIYKHDF